MDPYPTMQWLRMTAQKMRDALPYERVTLAGIPRGGLTVAALMARPEDVVLSAHGPWTAVDSPLYLVDDVCASGKTIEAYIDNTRLLFAGALVIYSKSLLRTHIQDVPLTVWTLTDAWVHFPWETNESGPEDAVRRLIEYVGDNPAREGLVDTPRRVLAYLDELRERSQEELRLTTFTSDCDDLIIEHNIAFSSLCEHHVLPYFGHVHVGYLPHGKVLGASKMARIVRKASAGLTIQEHLTRDIARQMQEATESESVAVTTRASHTCMTIRGIQANGAELEHSAMLGQFRESPALRAEFLSLTKGV